MSAFISNVNFYYFLFLLLLINYGTVSAYNINRKSMVLNDDQPNIFSDDLTASNGWPEPNQSPNYISAVPSYELRQGIIRLIPYKKRTIPLELQKALYAHGIVGRRR